MSNVLENDTTHGIHENESLSTISINFCEYKHDTWIYVCVNTRSYTSYYDYRKFCKLMTEMWIKAPRYVSIYTQHCFNSQFAPEFSFVLVHFSWIQAKRRAINTHKVRILWKNKWKLIEKKTGWFFMSGVNLCLLFVYVFCVRVIVFTVLFQSVYNVY